MPKIIENLPQRLLEEARKQCEELGYSAMTIRSVAKGCGVGVGTVYNYYPSKDALIAEVVRTDWMECMKSAMEPHETLEAALRSGYDGLRSFIGKNERLFRDEGAMLLFSGSGSHYHDLVCGELELLVRPFCSDDFTVRFVAEAVATWVAKGVDFETLCPILLRLV